jgi:N-acetylmuramoyl-L-alanine amidase
MKNVLKIVFVAVAFLSISFVSIEKEAIVVVIDAGHGGHDVGANHEIFLEKDIVNQIAKKIAGLNKQKNIKIHFTRTADNFLELKERTEFINNINPDIVISLHVNQNKKTTTTGFEAFVSDKNENLEKSSLLASQLVKTLENNIPLTNRGVKKAPFFVLANSKVPAIMLELGFMSNEKDRDFITNENGQTQIAQSILDFVTTIK